MFPPALILESPWLLAGLLLAGIPILIHFFFRRPHREIPWAATRFLARAAEKHAPRLRLEQLLLLALRVVLLMLVVFALSKPVFEGSGGAGAAVGEKPGRHWILVLDASYSMAHTLGGVSRFDRAKEALNGILETARPGDAFQLLRMTDLGPRLVIDEPSFQPRLVAEVVDEQKVSHGRAAPLRTLDDIQGLLAKYHSGRTVEVVIASDFQRIDWRGAAVSRGGLTEMLEAIRRRARISLADAALATGENQAVASLEMDEALLRTGRPARFSATVTGNGPGEGTSRRFQFLVDGQPTVTDRLSNTGGGSTTVAFRDTLTESGPHGLAFRLPNDELAIDNARFLAVRAVHRLRVLLVDGASNRDAEHSATYFLERAVAPAGSSLDEDTSDFAPHVISDAELAGTELSEYDAVVLANVELITQVEIDRLRAFAGAGGGVVIALGDRVRREAYNRLLAGEAGLLPVEFHEVVGRPENPDRPIPFSTATLEHPIARPFAGNPGTGLETDFVLAYLKTTFESSSSVRTALEFTSGDPAIITAPLGTGRIVLLTSSVDPSWAGPWPQIGRSFLPLMHEMVRYAATGRAETRQLRVGQTLRWNLPDRLAGLTATVTSPDGRSVAVPLESTAEGTTAQFEKTWSPGIYAVSVGAPLNKEALFAANVDPAESELEPLTDEQRRSLIRGSRMLRPESGSGGVGMPSRDWPISRWLLALALAALLAEQTMAWRFRRGLILLFAILAVYVAYALGNIAPTLGLLATVIIAVISAGAWWLTRMARGRIKDE